MPRHSCAADVTPSPSAEEKHDFNDVAVEDGRGTNYCNLFVYPVPRDFRNEHLLQLFAQFEPVEAAIMFHQGSGLPKGYGFVYFGCEENGRAAAAALSGATILHSNTNAGMQIRVSPSRFDGRKNYCLESRRVRFRVIQSAVEDAAIVRAHFETFGPAFWVDLRRPTKPRPGAWEGVVQYDTVEEARRAIQETHLLRVFGGGRRSPAVLARFERQPWTGNVPSFVAAWAEEDSASLHPTGPAISADFWTGAPEPAAATHLGA